MNPVPLTFDRRLVRQRRQRAAARLRDHDFLFVRARENLQDRLKDIRREFPLALQIGARGGRIGDDRIGRLIVMDLTASLPVDLVADEEALPFAPGTFDLVVSPSGLHTVNDLPGALVQIRRILKPDGLFLGAMAGGETLHQLRESLMQAELAIKGGISPRVFPFADKQQMGALMQRAGFALPVVDSETVTVAYENALRLMADLRGMGGSNAIAARSRSFAGKRLLAEAARLYQENFSEDDGRIPAAFETIYLTGWAPHENQQKPLRRGSATHRLADILDTEEKGTGDKTPP